MIYFDFEVFKYDWLMVAIDPSKDLTYKIINDKERLKILYNKYKTDIWVGYNSRNYDQFILKAILLDFNPKEVSDHLIVDGKKGWEYSSLFNEISLYSYDAMSKFHSLKQLEGFMGNNIKETNVPFDIDRKLTEEEIQQTLKYCEHDVEQTIEVFINNISDFNAHMDLISEFNLGLSSVNKTQAQLTAKAIGCRKKFHDDEWDIEFVPTIKISKYQCVWDWYKNAENFKYGDKLKVDVCGVPHIFGLGGVHGAPKEPLHKKGLIVHLDVNSYYPSLMIKYNLLTRNASDPQIFKDIYDKRLALKKAGKKKEQAPYKIILNSTFGISNDKYSQAYDPKRAHEVCINGQLLLLDLLEHLEGYCELIQSNTDGLIVQIPDTDCAWDKLDEICSEWEQRTGMMLGFDIIKEIYQGDVNNYLFIAEDGTIERKGKYVKELSSLDYDLPIVNKAMVNYMVDKIPVETTIQECDDLREFQKIVKISNKYLCGWHNGKRLTDKTFRVFASKYKRDTYIGKQKASGATIEKFADTPNHCFIDNENVNGKTSSRLDKSWYINLAKQRLQEKFGVQ